MYVGTPLGRVIALDPATGRERWVFDPKIARDVTYGDFASRGVSTWLDDAAAAGAPCRRRIFVATAQSQLFAARRARRHVVRGIRRRRIRRSQGRPAHPAVRAAGVFDDVAAGRRQRRRRHRIVDRRQQPRPIRPAAKCAASTRAPARCAWTWDPIPQDPARSGVRRVAWQRWRTRAAARTRGRSLAADPERDLVFVPTGSAAPDYYGALRLGDNRYANSIVALRASTGRVVWSFQTVHHDLWDYDNASPPALVTITRNGARVPAVRPGDQERHALRARPRHRPSGLSRRRASRSGERHPGRKGLADPAVHDRHAAAQPASLHASTRCGDLTDAIARRAARPSSRCATRASSRRPRQRHAGAAVEHRRRALGRRRHRSGAADLPIVPVNRMAAMVQLIPREGFDLQRVQGAGTAAGRRLRIQHDARHAVRHAPAHAAGAVEAALHAAAVRHAGRDRSENRRPNVGSAAGLGERLVQPRRRETGAGRRGARPTSAARSSRRRRRLHRRGARPPPPRLRHRTRARALAAARCRTAPRRRR